MNLPLNQILCGDCVDILKDFPDDGVDLVVTDPPYGLSFMGKDWDKTLPSREAFTEIIRVMKPGALAFVMSSPRQDLLWRMLALLEGVGFELTQSYIDWIYKTGFPKAYDVSKGIDRRALNNHPLINEIKQFLKDSKDKLGLTGKEIDKKLGLKGTNFSNHFTGAGGRGTYLPTKDQWFKLKEILDLDDRYDDLWLSLRAGKQRPIIGHKKTGDPISWYAQIERGDGIVDITIPQLDDAKKWDGWKSQTGLKPAHEPILMVNKPFSERTIVENVLKWGTGAINVDVCRIPINRSVEREYDTENTSGITGSNKGLFPMGDNQPRQDNWLKKGRFPANLLVSDKCFGDQSRYFDLDAWAEHHGFLDVPKPSKSERDRGLTGEKKIPKSKFNLNDGSKDMRFDGVVPTPRRNVHPTVKPIKLMAYLIELGCPKDGVVLDPFVGSGTTCIATKQLRRKYIGIDLNEEYCKIAEARIAVIPTTLHEFALPPKPRKT